MALSKKRNKERMRQSRATEVQPKPKEAVQPDTSDLETRLEKAGLKVGSDGLLDLTQSTTSPVIERGNTILPVYNPLTHRYGDRVLVDGKEATVPEYDAEGNYLGEIDDVRPVPPVMVSLSVVGKDSFVPAPKPEKKERRKHGHLT